MTSHFDKIADFYAHNFASVFSELSKNGAEKSLLHSENFKLLGWESRESQYKRFAVFSGVLREYAETNRFSLLDVGCGLGDLYHFLTQGLHLSFDYTGTDLLESMVDNAFKQATEIPLPQDVDSEFTFCLTDIFSDMPKENLLKGKTFDFVYTSGIFNLALGNNLEFLQKALIRFAEMCNVGFGCSILSTSSKNKEDTFFYYDKEMLAPMLAILKQKYPNSKHSFIEGYLDNDMTLIWHKNDL